MPGRFAGEARPDDEPVAARLALVKLEFGQRLVDGGRDPLPQERVFDDPPQVVAAADFAEVRLGELVQASLQVGVAEDGLNRGILDGMDEIFRMGFRRGQSRRKLEAVSPRLPVLFRILLLLFILSKILPDEHGPADQFAADDPDLAVPGYGYRGEFAWATH